MQGAAHNQAFYHVESGHSQNPAHSARILHLAFTLKEGRKPEPKPLIRAWCLKPWHTPLRMCVCRDLLVSGTLIQYMHTSRMQASGCMPHAACIDTTAASCLLWAGKRVPVISDIQSQCADQSCRAETGHTHVQVLEPERCKVAINDAQICALLWRCRSICRSATCVCVKIQGHTEDRPIIKGMTCNPVKRHRDD